MTARGIHSNYVHLDWHIELGSMSTSYIPNLSISPVLADKAWSSPKTNVPRVTTDYAMMLG